MIYQHALMLEKTSAKYPIKRVIVKNFVIPYNSSSFTITGIQRGIMPTRVVCGFLETKAYTGNLKKNPFNFINFGMSKIKLKVASVPVPYADGLSLDFKNDQYVQAYDALYKNVRVTGNDLTYDEYKNGYTLYAFDLSPDLCSCDHFNLLKDGVLELEVQLDNPISESYTVIFYLEFDNVVEINKERAVSFDYSTV